MPSVKMIKVDDCAVNTIVILLLLFVFIILGYSLHDPKSETYTRFSFRNEMATISNCHFKH